MGPPFYENWANQRDLNEDGTCASTDVNYASQVSDRNVRFWYLGGSSSLRDIAPGIDHRKPWGNAWANSNTEAHNACYNELKAANTLNLPYCFSRFSLRQYDEAGMGS